MSSEPHDPSLVCHYCLIVYERMFVEEVKMPTSKKDASKAGKLLAKPGTPKNVKSVAASDLAQTPKKPKR
jgi:hypothetical protein